MILLARGISGCGVLEKILDVPYHKIDLLITNPVRDHKINQRLVKDAIGNERGQNLLLGKSYGAWILSEIETTSPTLLVGLPMHDGKKETFPNIKNKNVTLLYSREDPHFSPRLFEENKEVFERTVRFSGDHSLRPHDEKKIKRIKEELDKTALTLKKSGGERDGERPRQSRRPRVHDLKGSHREDEEIFSFFLPDYKEYTIRIKDANTHEKIEPDELKIPQELREQLKQWYSPIRNIVKKKTPFRGISFYQSSILDSRIHGRVEKGSASGGLGVSTDEEEATKSCVYEALERHSLSSANFDSITCRYEDIPQELRVPEKELVFTKNAPTDALKNTIWWTRIESIEGDEEKLYPVQLITSSNIGCEIRQTTSTGTAAGSSREDAIRRGLLEAIERHSLMHWFYDTGVVRAREVRREECSPCDESETIARNIKSQGGMLHHYLIDYEGLQTICTIAEWEGGIAIGSACESPREALRGSLKEVLVTAQFSQTLKKTYHGPEDIKSLPDHYLYYHGERKKRLFEHLKKATRGRPSAEQRTYDLKMITKRLQEQGHKLYCKEVTAPETRPFKTVVFKTIVFGFLDVIKEHTKNWTEYYALRGVDIPEIPTPFP